MKKIYTIPLMFLLISIFGFQLEMPRTFGTIEGTITNEHGEPLIGANVMINKTSDGTATDIGGKYKLQVAAGTYDLSVSYTGFAAKAIHDVRVQAGKTTKLDVQLSEGMIVDEVVVVGYGTTKKSKSMASVRAKRTESKSMSAPKSMDVISTGGYADFDDATPAYIAAPTSEPSTLLEMEGEKMVSETGLTTKDIKHKKIKIKDSYFKAEGFLLEGKVVSENLIPMAELNPLEVIILEKAAKEILEEPKKQQPKAGQLTAGEWKDLDHFKDWKKQQEETDFQRAKTDWNFYLKNRYSVLVENKEGQPLADVAVELQNKQKEVLWKTRTDNFGKAELWANIFEEKKVEGKLRIVAHYNGEKFTIKKAKPFKKVNKLKIKKEKDCTISNRVDILFAVDATGSMQDEINYLKSELQDVIQQVKSADDDLDIRLGATFYRDYRDDYLTKSSPLDGNIERTVNFINQQTAGGGGDFPEAVDVALEEAIQKQNWSDHAVARIIFLVLDAPPHMANDNLASLQKSIRLAAEKGIKIIPVTASGINRSTEYLMKSMAMATNGTYVFITDDSGIGNDHLEPSNKDFKVEFLNDLMVRLITENTDRSACEKEEEELSDPQFFTNSNNQNTNSSTVVFQEDKSILNKVKYFPNPATTGITIQLQETISVIEIISANGQVVKRLEHVQAGEEYLDLGGLSEGFYLIRFKKERSVASGKLIIIKP